MRIFHQKILPKVPIGEFRNSTEDFQLIDSGPLTINGKDAYDVFLTYKHPNKGILKNEYIFISADKRLYIFSLQDTISLGEYIKMASIMLNMVYSAQFIEFGTQTNLNKIVVTPLLVIM